MEYQTLEALHHDLDRCRLCAEAHYDIQSQPVFSGRAAARLMLIGQAPGQEEVPTRKPFSGDAGKRLFRWLRRVGWTEEEFRERFYITSVTKCFPGKAEKGSGDRVPSAAERDLCRPWMEWELHLVQPEVIIPVGKLAINLFFPPDTKMDEVIGQRILDEAGRHIVPLPHPSGASRWHMDPRNVGYIDQAIWHLKRLRQELGL